MPVETRELYRSPTGDRWLLSSDAERGRVFVKHEANLASGGRVSDTDIGTFLSGLLTPEEHALLRLIAAWSRKPWMIEGGEKCLPRHSIRSAASATVRHALFGAS
jgi:hypothetical protein